MIDIRETVWIRGEEDDVKLSLFGVQMKPVTNKKVFSGTVMNCQCLSVKAG